MSRRVEYRAWGASDGEFSIPSYAMRRDDESRQEAVWRSISSAIAPVEIIGKRHDRTAIGAGGHAEADHYEIQLGTPLPTGERGYNGAGRLFVIIPRA